MTDMTVQEKTVQTVLEKYRDSSPRVQSVAVIEALSDAEAISRPLKAGEIRNLARALHARSTGPGGRWLSLTEFDQDKWVGRASSLLAEAGIETW